MAREAKALQREAEEDRRQEDRKEEVPAKAAGEGAKRIQARSYIAGRDTGGR